MTTKQLLISGLIGLSLLTGAPALAQMDSEVEAALEAGTVGEQADGYMGFARAPAGGLKAKVDAINIKRRQGYTQIAQSKNVPIEAFAASIGCRTLEGLKTGRAYNIGGAWAVKSGPITLPAQCGA
ncbi:YdbL family protein [Sphingomonas sp. AP4-R1]|uniref:YdbL family protein n=1 Tax=Sphingomonas sp. AP4-R1 TaxID=2735134 RepID=UPI001493CB4A|nr:YdbL family protein [Sphingomonas sp. AP4-R1]QJU56578.1 YdbL family protein [Sphingomonas sp. AP4-R1]